MYEVRDKACRKYVDSVVLDNAIHLEDLLNEAFNAGWKARKTAEYEAIVLVGRDD